MSIYIPSMSEIAEVSRDRGANSDAPDLWRGLVGWWPMQEGGGATAFDASGYRRNGVWSGTGTRTGIGLLGRTGVFNGTNDSITVSGIPAFGTGNFALSAWISPAASFSTNNVAIGRGTIGDGEWMFGGASGNVLRFVGDGALICPSGGIVTLGAWHHCCVSRFGKSTSVYLASTQVGIHTYSGVVDLNTPKDMTIGTGDARYFQGSITLVGAWSRALAPSEIQQLYADPWAMGTLRRRVFPVAVAASTPAFAPWLIQPSQIIGGGIA